MAETTLVIAGRHYTIRCRDGEEAHLAHLSTMIADKAKVAEQSAAGLTEVRTLLFAALFLADELNDAKRAASDRQTALHLSQANADADDAAARAIESLAERLEKLAARLAVGDQAA
ncbi:MAG: cell division protein ZapA [Sphingobium sp.]